MVNYLDKAGLVVFWGKIKEYTKTIEQRLQGSINDINSLIPGQASADNQLADKDFVNSSIATSTAEFKGTYDSLEELQEVEADANDYGFVREEDEDGNVAFKRYKYSDGEWLYEYTLNNSSFTSDQWKAINSAITSGDVEKLRSLMSREDLDQKFEELSGSISGKVDRSELSKSTVAEANRLSNAVKLWGQSFDGSGNVDGELSDVNGITFKHEGALTFDQSEA